VSFGAGKVIVGASSGSEDQGAAADGGGLGHMRARQERRLPSAAAQRPVGGQDTAPNQLRARTIPSIFARTPLGSAGHASAISSRSAGGDPACTPRAHVACADVLGECSGSAQPEAAGRLLTA
jgi:hypothetical protein